MPKMSKATADTIIADTQEVLEDVAHELKERSYQIDEAITSITSAMSPEKLKVVLRRAEQLIRGLRAEAFDTEVLCAFIAANNDQPVMTDQLVMRKLTEEEMYFATQTLLLNKKGVTMDEILDGTTTKEDEPA